MDKGDLLPGHTPGHQLVPDVVVEIERFLALLGRGDVAENELGQLLGRPLTPEPQDVLHAPVDLGAGLIRQQGIDNPLVQAQFAAVAGNAQHVVNVGVYEPAVDLLRPLGQLLDHDLLVLGGLRDDVVVLDLGGGQVELAGGLDVGCLFEHHHQLGQIEEPGESRPGPVAGALRGQLQGGHRFAEERGPAVEVLQPLLNQEVVLEIALNGIHLGHGVGDGSPGGEDDAPPARDFVQVAALGEHVAGLLGVGGGQARHVAHFGV